jgi:hypothetical protein
MHAFAMQAHGACKRAHGACKRTAMQRMHDARCASLRKRTCGEEARKKLGAVQAAEHDKDLLDKGQPKRLAHVLAALGRPVCDA